ncbi:hypothetical protein ANCDUO_04058 [Ancylostoma duodenale]|uniref:Uncharacterized protein n=1 Tax=Ancylostoma duodenale TaxID=51022 RepID=A0A0C2DS60_9BILA|nr:hypothetical protein ANCDUO_04058 [Ancylostoma duodenale]
MKSKLNTEISERIEEDGRASSIVMTGIPECSEDLPPCGRQGDVENRVRGILNVLKVVCRPQVIYGMGRMSPS